MVAARISRQIRFSHLHQAQKVLRHFHHPAALRQVAPPQVVLYQVVLYQAALLQRFHQVLLAPQAKQQAQFPLR